MTKNTRTGSTGALSTRRQRAFTLIELMVAMTVGLLLMSALLAVFLNVSRTNREMARTNILIENGRFAVQLLESDLVHAGYWGELDYTSTDPTPTFANANAIPDPCAAVASWTSAYKDNLLAIPVQGYANGAALTGCGITSGSVLGTSDVLVIRHANTCARGAADCAEGADTGPHIQVSTCRSEVSPGATEPFYAMAVSGDTPSTAAFPLRDKACPPTPVAAIDAPLRKVISHIFYLATSSNQPTLMRASLENGAYGTPQPFIEGIEEFRVEYGVDENGKNGLPISATNPGDGSADRFVTTAQIAAAPTTACDVAGSRCFLLANTVAVRVHVLARNLEPTPGYTDTKTYDLGETTVDAKNDNFKRHVFSRTVRLVNPSGRRETP
ncbi:PilW family protein [Aromatoleum toluolicum]|nr:PilW family protein [Aromatoleum toluolicum]NMF97275.2 PilW family protein [Aromatoleum toluolicum]